MSFDSQTALTRGVNPLEGAVWGVRPLADLGLGNPTFVLRHADAEAPEGCYIGQFRHRPGDEHAHIVFAAPSLDADAAAPDDQNWGRLFEAMTAAAGVRGAFTLNAEVAETGNAFLALRQAGFAVYTRQEIWRREPAPLAPDMAEKQQLLRLCQPNDLDAVGISSLYHAVVPRMVRSADPSPDTRHGLVYTYKGRILGYLNAQEGKNGVFVQSIIAPEVGGPEIEDMLCGVLCYLPHAHKLPVYFNVRRYQSWLGGALPKLGFAPYMTQAVMVRHTVRRIESVAYKAAPALDGVALALPRNREY
jgi:hypothetical protein